MNETDTGLAGGRGFQGSGAKRSGGNGQEFSTIQHGRDVSLDLFYIKRPESLLTLQADQRIPSTLSPSLRGFTSRALNMGSPAADWTWKIRRFSPGFNSTGFWNCPMR